MHIPDGFLNNSVSVGLIGVAATAVVAAFRRVRAAFLEKVPVLKLRLATFPNLSDGQSMTLQSRLSKIGREKVWKMASIGSLIFSAQMVNFPIGGGTSGHLLGGVLAALLIGPFEALLIMTVILVTQSVFFGDGGIVALGANIVNMGVIGAYGGYLFFRFLRKGKRDVSTGFLPSVFVAAWVSVILASVAASFEIAFSGTRPLAIVLPAMTLTHILIGLMEGVITTAVLWIFLRNKWPIAVTDTVHQNKNIDGYE